MLQSRRAQDRPFTLERRYGGGYRKVVFPSGDPPSLNLPLLDGDRVTYKPQVKGRL